MIDKSPAPGEAHLRSALSQLHADCMCTIKGAIFPVRKKRGKRKGIPLDCVVGNDK